MLLKIDFVCNMWIDMMEVDIQTPFYVTGYSFLYYFGSWICISLRLPLLIFLLGAPTTIILGLMWGVEVATYMYIEPHSK